MSNNSKQQENTTGRGTKQKTFTKQLKILFRWLSKTLRKFLVILRRHNRWDKALAVCLIIFWLVIILGYFFFPGSYIFEGYLTIKEMSFTYNGQVEKLFLQSINEIKNLDLEGVQVQPVTLKGKFSSSQPALNKKLSQLNQITISLENTRSRLIFTPINSSDSEISIIEMRLRPESQVNQLTYEPRSNRLSFCLQAASMSADSCVFPDNLPQTNSNAIKILVGNLKLKLGEKPLTVKLAMANIRELDIKTDDEILLQFVPQVDELFLPIFSPTHLFIDLPRKNQAEKSAMETQWLRGDINVSDVSFSQSDRTNNVTDEIQNSTVLEGKVRMGSQTIELQPNQFLIPLSKQPGIYKLRNIQINPLSPQGLKTVFLGESKGIAVGLYPEFPLQKIEPTWLSKYLSQEATNSILAFIAAFTGILLPRLFSESSSSKKT
jgi:hypothetical protein